MDLQIDNEEHVQGQEADQDQEAELPQIANATENVINDYFIDNRGTMLFLVDEDEELLKEKLKSCDHVFIEATSENLFQYISTEKTAPIVIIKDFYPSSNNTKENAKIMNIIKQLLYYGQSIICISEEEERAYCKEHMILFNK